MEWTGLVLLVLVGFGIVVTGLPAAVILIAVAVFGAIWIDASPAMYVRRVKDIENFERGYRKLRAWRGVSDHETY